MPVIAHFRFYAELNNFLAPSQRQRTFSHACARDATAKHMIEALGVPHTEVDLILVDGSPVDFSHRLHDGERIAVYPAFASVDPAMLPRLRPPPEFDGSIRFVADAHLGQLAKHLRMLGFDVLYRNDFSDAEVARFAVDEHRVVLTRDRDLLIRKDIVHGCYLHALSSDDQLREVVSRFDLASAVRSFSRCLNCNSLLHSIEKGEVAHRVPSHSREVHEHFYECRACAQVYWEGSHVARMRARLARVLDAAGIEL